MKFCLLISLFCGLVISTRAAVMQGTYKDPKYPGKCVVHDLIVSPGEVVLNPFSNCMRLLCGEEGGVVFHTCGAILPPKGHKLGEPINPTAPYPDCCTKHFISIDNNTK